MPSYVERDGGYFISYITGPKHIRLGLKFSLEASTVECIKNCAVANKSRQNIDEQELILAVEVGVHAYMQESGLRLFVSKIEYVADDSPDYALFAHCTRLLARRFSNSGA